MWRQRQALGLQGLVVAVDLLALHKAGDDLDHHLQLPGGPLP